MTDFWEFRLGDVVGLASGGPLMKVIGFSPNENIWCQWRWRDCIEEHSFAPSLLRHAY